MKILIILSALFLTACGSQLRHPLCKDSLTEFPDDMVGTYTITSVQPDPSANNASSFTEQTIEIKKDGIGIPGAFIHQIILPPMGNLCMIGGRVFGEKINDNSTVTMTKIEATSYGLALSELSFSVDDLKSKNIPYIVVPELSILGTDLEQRWTDNIMIGPRTLIVDNSNTSANDLIKIAKRVSMYVTMNRVSQKIKGPKSFLSLRDLKPLKVK